MYTLKQVTKHYGEKQILSDITCTIPVDGLVAVMGPSGSGKSTLLRLLSFVELPDHGAVQLTLGGDDFDSRNESRPWPRLTCVFQKQFLWPHLTIRENLYLPLRSVAKREATERVDKVIDLFDMADFIARFPNQVSGGQAQRAALARALVLEPKMVLIDEAHSGLDLEQQAVLNEHFLSLRSSGVGLVIVTHSLDFARSFSDHVVIVENGTITFIGCRDVFKHPQSEYLRVATRLADQE